MFTRLRALNLLHVKSKVLVALAKILGNWQGFLHVNENKTERFKFAAETLVEKAEVTDKIFIGRKFKDFEKFSNFLERKNRLGEVWVKGPGGSSVTFAN